VMCSVAELASGPVTLAPGGIPGAVPTGVIAPTPGPGWRPAGAALALSRPAVPISKAVARLTVHAAHVRRFSIPVSPVPAQPRSGGC